MRFIIHPLCIILISFPAFNVYSQTGSITAVQVAQRTDGSGLADIYYNLSGPATSYEVTAEVSFDNGTNYYAIFPQFLSGHAGQVTPGTGLHIVWDGKGSHPNTFSYQSIIRLTASNFSCGQVLTDTRNNKTYNTIMVNGLCWMQQNLNLGTKIAATGHQQNNQVFEKYCYNELESNCTVYGGLYQWGELVQYLYGGSNTTSWNPVPATPVQGICPAGWHIPSDAEWLSLVNYLGGASVAGGKMKETGYAHWTSPNTGATNSSGLTVLPGGGVNVPMSSYGNLTMSARIWSASEASATTSSYRLLSYFAAYANGNTSVKTTGASVRCVKN